MEQSKQDSEPTGINRRHFLMLAVAGVTAPKAVEGNPTADRLVDAGPASNYSVEGLYSGFRDQGFFLVRKGAQLLALSAACTHRKCKLTAKSDRSFYCNCHGSMFDPSGKVTEGPAKRDLPVLPTMVSDRGHLLVKIPVA
jgi:nitrite reductase/ring-hydroxylating ferredoxin subunit